MSHPQLPRALECLNHNTPGLTMPASRYDYKTGAISPDVAEQAEQCMANIASALAEAGAGVADVVRVRYILPERSDFPATWPVLQRWLGEVRPAATMIVAGLMNEEMRIEVEVTARKRRGGEGKDVVSKTL